jgi:hypothetical protein
MGCSNSPSLVGIFFVGNHLRPRARGISISRSPGWYPVSRDDRGGSRDCNYYGHALPARDAAVWL